MTEPSKEIATPPKDDPTKVSKPPREDPTRITKKERSEKQKANDRRLGQLALARKEENRRLAEEKKRGEVLSTSSSSSSQNEESSGLGLVALLLGGGLAAIRAIVLAVKYLFGKKESVRHFLLLQKGLNPIGMILIRTKNPKTFYSCKGSKKLA